MNECISYFQYAVIIGVLIVLEIAVVVTAYFFYDKVIDLVGKDLVKALNQNYDSKFTETTTGSGTFDYTPGNILSKGIDAIQIEVRYIIAKIITTIIYFQFSLIKKMIQHLGFNESNCEVFSIQ